MTEQTRETLARLDEIEARAKKCTYADRMSFEKELTKVDVPDLVAAVRELHKRASGTLANNLCSDHRDKQDGKDCLACEIERLQTRLATAEGLLKRFTGIESFRESLLSTYAGGHHCDGKLDAFQHGMDTVCNCLEQSYGAVETYLREHGLLEGGSDGQF